MARKKRRGKDDARRYTVYVNAARSDAERDLKPRLDHWITDGTFNQHCLNAFEYYVNGAITSDVNKQVAPVDVDVSQIINGVIRGFVDYLETNGVNLNSTNNVNVDANDDNVIDTHMNNYVQRFMSNGAYDDVEIEDD